MKLKELKTDTRHVVKHGIALDNYEENKNDELNLIYPFCICPECGSYDDTRVVDGVESNYGFEYTGREFRDPESSIFDRTLIKVCYECHACGCKWHKDFIKDKTEYKLDGEFALFVISVVVVIVSIIFLVLSTSIFDTGQESLLDFVLGPVLTIVSSICVAIFLVCVFWLASDLWG